MHKIRLSRLDEYSGCMDVRIEESWKNHLAAEFEKPYFTELTDFVKNEYKTKKIYPPPKDIFRAFDLTPFEKVKVVILGQDPYHGPKQANGLCFAVHEGIQTPPSLQNIFKEIESDLGHPSGVELSKMDAVRGAQGIGDEPYKTYGEEHVPQRNEEMRHFRKSPNPDLSRWAKQGVLLLNATLTVEAGKAGSHQHKGWEEFTDAAIQALSDERENLVFILWGNYAKQKGARIDRTKHCVLESAHPSPFSADRFFGTKPFSKTNDYLQEHGETPIEW